MPRGKAGREEGKARVKKAEEGEFGGASRVETLRLSTWGRSLGLSVAFEGQGPLGSGDGSQPGT